MPKAPHLFDPAPIIKDLQTVVFEKRDHIAYIRFNRPERMNAMNQRMCEELYAIWLHLRRDPDTYVAIITGTGRAFQAGRDVKELAEYQARAEIVPRDDPRSIYHKVQGFPDYAEFNKPIIAAVNGICAGGGLSFLTRSHIRVMAEDAYLTDGHLNVGQLISPARYIRDFGFAAAMYLYLCKGRLSAQECCRLGIVNEVCPKEQVVERATAYARMMCEIAPSILQRGAGLASSSMADDAVHDQLQHALHMMVQEEEPAGKESTRAFIEKRHPKL